MIWKWKNSRGWRRSVCPNQSPRRYVFPKVCRCWISWASRSPFVSSSCSTLSVTTTQSRVYNGHKPRGRLLRSRTWRAKVKERKRARRGIDRPAKLVERGRKTTGNPRPVRGNIESVLTLLTGKRELLAAPPLDFDRLYFCELSYPTTGPPLLLFWPHFELAYPVYCSGPTCTHFSGIRDLPGFVSFNRGTDNHPWYRFINRFTLLSLWTDRGAL